jgi:hypothetical protein
VGRTLIILCQAIGYGLYILFWYVINTNTHILVSHGIFCYNRCSSFFPNFFGIIVEYIMIGQVTITPAIRTRTLTSSLISDGFCLAI